MKIGEDEAWKTCLKVGDVNAKVWDKGLGKNVVRIQGASSSSNYLQIPDSKHLPKKVLGLTGNYVYLMVQRPEQKNFVIHLDYLIDGTRLTKISLSSIYKEFKNAPSSNSMQIPVQLEPAKWTVLCINVKQLLEQNGLIRAGFPEHEKPFYLRSLQICSMINVRGVYTTDLAYNVGCMPEEIRFRLPKEADWFAHYNWQAYPSQDLNDVPLTKTAPD